MLKSLRSKAAKLKVLYDYTGAAYVREFFRTRNRPNAIFIWIPKTAGTSLYSTLNAPKLKNLHLLKYRFTGRGTVTFGHMDYARLVEEGYVSQEFHKTSYKFAFVRNPYARAVSLHSYLTRVGAIPKTSFLDFCRVLRDSGCRDIGLFNRRELSQCNPQNRWLKNVEVNYIGKMESLDQDAQVVFEKLQLGDVRIPQLNKSTSRAYSESYCSESKEIVESFYRVDFETYGYRYEDFPSMTRAGLEV